MSAAARRHRLLLAVALVAAALALGHQLVAEPVLISGTSMEPALHSGELVLVDKLATAGLHRGDVVVFDGTGTAEGPGAGLSHAKRVVGLPGETLACCDGFGAVTVNGVALAGPAGTSTFGPVRVPAGTYFVLGDHRSDSADSRTYGPVPAGAVLGTLTVRLWPPGRIPDLP